MAAVNQLPRDDDEYLAALPNTPAATPMWRRENAIGSSPPSAFWGLPLTSHKCMVTTPD